MKQIQETAVCSKHSVSPHLRYNRVIKTTLTKNSPQQKYATPIGKRPEGVHSKRVPVRAPVQIVSKDKSQNALDCCEIAFSNRVPRQRYGDQQASPIQQTSE